MCEAWKLQGKEMWAKVGKLCVRKHPRAPTIRALFDERATRAALAFLREAKVGQSVTIPPPRPHAGRGEEGPGPPP